MAERPQAHLTFPRCNNPAFWKFSMKGVTKLSLNGWHKHKTYLGCIPLGFALGDTYRDRPHPIQLHRFLLCKFCLFIPCGPTPYIGVYSTPASLSSLSSSTLVRSVSNYQETNTTLFNNLWSISLFPLPGDCWKKIYWMNIITLENSNLFCDLWFSENWAHLT